MCPPDGFPVQAHRNYTFFALACIAADQGLQPPAGSNSSLMARCVTVLRSPSPISVPPDRISARSSSSSSMHQLSKTIKWAVTAVATEAVNNMLPMCSGRQRNHCCHAMMMDISVAFWFATAYMFEPTMSSMSVLTSPCFCHTPHANLKCSVPQQAQKHGLNRKLWAACFRMAMEQQSKADRLNGSVPV